MDSLNVGKRGSGCLLMRRRKKIVLAMGVFEFPMKKLLVEEVEEEEAGAHFLRRVRRL